MNNISITPPTANPAIDNTKSTLAGPFDSTHPTRLGSPSHSQRFIRCIGILTILDHLHLATSTLLTEENAQYHNIHIPSSNL